MKTIFLWPTTASPNSWIMLVTWIWFKTSRQIWQVISEIALASKKSKFKKLVNSSLYFSRISSSIQSSEGKCLWSLHHPRKRRCLSRLFLFRFRGITPNRKVQSKRYHIWTWLRSKWNPSWKNYKHTRLKTNRNCKEFSKSWKSVGKTSKKMKRSTILQFLVKTNCSSIKTW